MKGKDLIVYILNRNLENEDIDDIAEFLDAIDHDNAAMILNCGKPTIETYVANNVLYGFKIDGKLYILPNGKLQELKMLTSRPTIKY